MSMKMRKKAKTNCLAVQYDELIEKKYLKISIKKDNFHMIIT